MIRYTLMALALMGLSTAALALLRPGWATTAGIDVWNLPELQRDQAGEDRRAEELGRRHEVLLGRVRAKDQVLRDLLEGRLSLLESAARYRNLDVEHPGAAPDGFPGRSEGERYCRQIIQCAKVETSHWTPSHAEAVLRGLEAELNAHLVRHGGDVILPEV